MYTVYKTVNLVNGKYYIGVHKTDNPNDGYLGSGKLIKAAIVKYGAESFNKQIIAIFDDKESAYLLEKELVTIEELSYNLKLGGEGGFDYLNTGSSSHLLRCSVAGKLGAKRANEVINAKLTDHDYHTQWLIRQRYKVKKAKEAAPTVTFLGKTHSIETRQKMSQKGKERTGSKNSQFGTIWITNGIVNKKIKSIDDLPDGFYRGRV